MSWFLYWIGAQCHLGGGGGGREEWEREGVHARIGPGYKRRRTAIGAISTVAGVHWASCLSHRCLLAGFGEFLCFPTELN